MKRLLLILSLAGAAASAQSHYEQFQEFNEKLKPFRPEMEVFSNDRGQYIVEADHFSGRTYLGDNIFYCEDLNCHQMSQTGYGGRSGPTEISYHAGFKDSRMDRSKYEENGLFRDNDKIKSVCNDITSEFKKATGPVAERIREQARMIPIPEVRGVEYFAKVPSTGEVIFISADKNNYSYNSFKLFMGKPGALKEYKIENVERYRDGGTTNVYSEAGKLFFPNGSAGRGLPPSLTLPDGKKIAIEPTRRPDQNELAAAIGKERMDEMQEKPLRTFCDIPSKQGDAQPGTPAQNAQ